MAFQRSLTANMPKALLVMALVLLVTPRTVHCQEQQQQQQQQQSAASLRGGAAAAAAASLSEEVKEEVHLLEAEEEHGGDGGPELIPAEYAVYTDTDGDVEITVHRIPIQKLESGEEMDPWMQMAVAQGIDLNDYNVTYPGRTADTLEDDHRRHLMTVNAWENNNARFCQYERQRRSLQQVSWSYDLIQQAQMQAAYMARVRHIEHRPNLAAGVAKGWKIICENVSQNVNMGYNGAHMSLMNDQGHKDNILNKRVNRIGVGVARYGPYYYMCQLFKGTS
jgi:Cysteine-rich secretory protein family